MRTAHNRIHLIWDLDGTLVDSEPEILHHLEHALRDASINIKDCLKSIRIGPPLEAMLKDAFPSSLLTESKLAEVLANFRHCYDNSSFAMTKAFDGINEIIENTDVFIHHIVTNKPDIPTKRIIDKIGWKDRFVSVSTPSADKKPKVQLFSDVIAQYSGGVAAFIGIGDMRTDCLAAKQNNIQAVGVLWGTGARDELLDCCDYIAENTVQLKDYLYRSR